MHVIFLQTDLVSIATEDGGLINFIIGKIDYSTRLYFFYVLDKIIIIFL